MGKDDALTFWRGCIDWDILTPITIRSVEPIMFTFLKLPVVGLLRVESDREMTKIDQICIDSLDSLKMAYARLRSETREGYDGGVDVPAPNADSPLHSADQTLINLDFVATQKFQSIQLRVVSRFKRRSYSRKYFLLLQ